MHSEGSVMSEKTMSKKEEFIESLWENTIKKDRDLIDILSGYIEAYEDQEFENELKEDADNPKMIDMLISTKASNDFSIPPQYLEKYFHFLKLQYEHLKKLNDTFHIPQKVKFRATIQNKLKGGER